MAKKENLEPKVEQVVEPKVDNRSEVDKFIARKLKALNQMSDQRKAKELANRVMRNARKGK